VHAPNSRAVVLENTNNSGGGSVWPLENMAGIRAVAREHGLHVHLDGARLMNACVASGHKPTDYTRHVDSVTTCFSKGLGAPVGSVVAGPRAFIERCRRFRRMFGGGMRQAGIIAAGALYAIEHNVARLAEDHANARRLAEALADLPCVKIDPATVETNIVIFDLCEKLASAADFCAQLKARGVWMLPVGPQRVRAVTHLDVTTAQVDQAIDVIAEVCEAAVA
jgi:threonine aldolase